MQKATNRSGHPKSPDIYQSYSNEYQAFIQGQKTAEEALAAIETAWNELFSS
jgi:ABC-type glycerol-3-phosphate transport system substrate-binding protein